MPIERRSYCEGGTDARDEARRRRIVQVEFSLRPKGRSDPGLLHCGKLISCPAESRCSGRPIVSQFDAVRGASKIPESLRNR
jgi:hypothetical protein